MSCQSRIAEWTAVIRPHLPMLSQPQATGLALWSLGVGLAHSCALTAVAVFVAGWCHRKEQTVRQQLREFCYEVEATRGDHRQALAIEPCFEPLLRWVLRGWQGAQVALPSMPPPWARAAPLARSQRDGVGRVAGVWARAWGVFWAGVSAGAATAPSASGCAEPQRPGIRRAPVFPESHTVPPGMGTTPPRS